MPAYVFLVADVQNVFSRHSGSYLPAQRQVATPLESRLREGVGESHSILFAFYCKVQKAALVARGAGQDLLQFWSTSGHAFAGLPAAGWSSLAMSARPGRPLNFGWIVTELPCDLTIGLAPPASSTARPGRPLIVGSIGADASLDSGPRTDSPWHCMFGQIDLLLVFCLWLNFPVL